MTPRVDASLWMAPEVILGEKYNVKADIFSFGVILSELDVHTLPYARFREENLDSNGRKMTDSILLEKVAQGTSIVEIGRSCMTIDPNERPTAVEVSYRLHMILSGKNLDLPIHLLSHRLIFLAVVQTDRFVVGETMYSISASYLGDQCGGTPYAVNIARNDECSIETCSPSSNISNADMMTIDCASDYIQATRDKFGSSPYIIELIFVDESCSDFAAGYGYPASGTCVGGYNETNTYYVIASLEKNGSASIEFYPDRSCLSSTVESVDTGDVKDVASHECDANWIKWFSSNDAIDTSGSALASNSSTGDESSAALSNGAILGLVL
ncbi:TKL protein kinase, partial [Phytophthora palmivora]